MTENSDNSENIYSNDISDTNDSYMVRSHWRTVVAVVTIVTVVRVVRVASLHQQQTCPRGYILDD